MSISAALSSAVSGLSATGRAAQTASQNVANALTPGYGVREVRLSSDRTGGVRVDAVDRRTDIALLTDRRAADASSAGAGTRLSALEKVADAVGRADSATSIAARLGDLNARFLDAASRPDSDIRLEAAVRAADEVVGAFNAAGAAIQDQRLAADGAIGDAVAALNRGLARIDELNDQIAKATATGTDANSLIDMRHKAIDEIADTVPLRQIDREGGRVALITDTGRVLLDSRPAEIGFAPFNGMSAGSTLGAPLSGLTVDGRAIDMTDPKSAMAGGRLEALFDLRDTRLPAAQARLDSLALDLVQRFEAVDTGPGSGGLFGFDGTDPATVPGAAQRLELSADVAAEPRRLRDGLDGAPGPVGESRLLTSFAEVLTTSGPPSGMALSSGSKSLLQLGDILTGRETAEAYRTESDLAYAESRAATLREAELQKGVDTDAEMQKLLLIEQSYAANARVIQVAGSMIDRILEI